MEAESIHRIRFFKKDGTAGAPMNVVFWGGERRCGTSAHMAAVVSILKNMFPQMQIVFGGQTKARQNKEAICFYDGGVGLNARKQRMLWHADLVVVNLRPQTACLERFFREDFHVARNIFYLLGSCYECDTVDRAYLERVYRVEQERIGIIPCNEEFYHAVLLGRAEQFVDREFLVPTSLRNEQFLKELQMAAAAIVQAARESDNNYVQATAKSVTDQKQEKQYRSTRRSRRK